MRFARGMLLKGVVIVISGCASPPSVAPLLHVAGRAMEAEAAHLADDVARHRETLRQQQDAVAAAFESDVRQRGTAEAAWVIEGSRVYVAAREAMLRHHMELERQVETRRENLRLAADAVGRAAQLLEQQDELLRGLPDVRRWMQRMKEEAEHE